MYDHPGYVVRREAPLGEIGGANQAYAKFTHFQKFRLNAVHYTVTTAGTSAANNTQVINKISGTTTTALGTMTAGTNAAGSRIDSASFTTNTNNPCSPGDIIQINQGADTVGKGAVVFEYEVLSDATQTT